MYLKKEILVVIIIKLYNSLYNEKLKIYFV